MSRKDSTANTRQSDPLAPGVSSAIVAHKPTPPPAPTTLTPSPPPSDAHRSRGQAPGMAARGEAVTMLRKHRKPQRPRALADEHIESNPQPVVEEAKRDSRRASRVRPAISKPTSGDAKKGRNVPVKSPVSSRTSSSSPSESSEASSSSTESDTDDLSTDSDDGNGDDAVDGIAYMLPRAVRTHRLRQIDDMMTVIKLAGTHQKVDKDQTPSSPSLFPLASLGYLLRSVGLNPSNEQVVLMERDLWNRAEATAARGNTTEVEGVEGDANNSVREDVVRAFVCDMLTMKVFHGQWIGPENETAIYDAFRVLDRDNKGYLTRQELREAMTSYGSEPFTDEEIEELLEAAGTTASGHVYSKESDEEQTLFSGGADDDDDDLANRIQNAQRGPDIRDAERISYADFASFLARE